MGEKVCHFMSNNHLRCFSAGVTMASVWASESFSVAFLQQLVSQSGSVCCGDHVQFDRFETFAHKALHRGLFEFFFVSFRVKIRLCFCKSSPNPPSLVHLQNFRHSPASRVLLWRGHRDAFFRIAVAWSSVSPS